MSERTTLEGIRERDADCCKLHKDTCLSPAEKDRRWLLARVEEMENALRHAEWHCAPGSEFCPSCHAPMEAMTFGNGKKHKGGHEKTCRLNTALAALHAPEEGSR